MLPSQTTSRLAPSAVRGPVSQHQLPEPSEMGECETNRALRYLAERLEHPLRVGIVLGSGLGGLVDLMNVRQVFPYREIPGWPEATALGHAGNLVVGDLAGIPVAALQGRLHLYEGHSREAATRPIAVLSQLGVSGWVISNAAGGLNPLFRRGDLMVLDGHLDLSMKVGRARVETVGIEERNSERGTRADGGGLDAPWHARGGCYDASWIERFMATARQQDVVVHRGCYAMVSGPTYETRAEYRAFRKFGADAVGMSTVPEVLRARQEGARVLGISVITNEAKPDAPIQNDADDVIAAAHDAEAGLKRLLISWLQSLSPELAAL